MKEKGEDLYGVKKRNKTRAQLARKKERAKER